MACNIVQQLRADAIHSEIRTGNPKETRLSWVAADEIERLRAVLLKIEQETIDYVAVRAARAALAMEPTGFVGNPVGGGQ